MDDNDYEQIPDESQEINQSLENAGSRIQNSVSNFGHGVSQGINNGLKSSKQKLNNEDRTDIPDKKEDSQIGVTNVSNNSNLTPKNNNEVNQNNRNNKQPSDLDNSNTNRKNNKKTKDVSGLSEKEKNSTSKKADKTDKDEKNPLKKLFGKNTKDKSGKNSSKGILNNGWKSLPFVVRLKIISIGLGILVLVVMLCFALTYSEASTVLRNITNNFVCSMQHPFPKDSWSVTKLYGWSEPYEIGTNDDGETIYRSDFTDGIYLTAEKGTKVYAVQPGEIIDLQDIKEKSYILIDHNKNDEYTYDDINKFKTKFSNLEEIFRDIKKDDSVVKETTLGYIGDNPIYFQVLQNNKGVDTTGIFGYEPIEKTVCANIDLNDGSFSVTGTAGDKRISAIFSKNCSNNPQSHKKFTKEEYDDWLYNSCGTEYDFGIPEGEYESLACGSSNYTATGPSKEQCAAGVFQYFKSFLPETDSAAWQKFFAIHATGGAVQYWTQNNALGGSGFKADSNPTAGSIWVSSYSKQLCDGGKACGHVMVVTSVEGNNVNVYECNHDGNNNCWYHTYTKEALSNRNGFLGYIHILGDC